MPIQDLRLDLLHEIRNLDIKARRMALSQILSGNFATIFKGRGIEFSGFRRYQYGDDASLIDWSASLRAKQIVIRDFEVYRSFNAFLILDVGDTMLFSSNKKLKAEYAAEIAYAISYSVLSSDNAFGMAMATDTFKARIPLRSGLGNMKIITTALKDGNNYGGDFDFEKIVKLIMSYLKVRSKIFIISDFLSMKPNWYKFLQVLGVRYDVTGIMVRDIRDKELPENSVQLLLQDPKSGEKMYIDTKHYAKIYKTYVEKEEKTIENYFKNSKSKFLKIYTNKDYSTELLKFFAIQRDEM